MEVLLVVQMVVNFLIENCNMPERRAQRIAQRRGPIMQRFARAAMRRSSPGITRDEREANVDRFMVYQSGLTDNEISDVISVAYATEDPILAIAVVDESGAASLSDAVTAA